MIQLSKWHEQLHGLMLVYDSTVHDSTGMSPFQAMFASCPRIPVDCTLRIPQMNNDVKNLSPKTCICSIQSQRIARNVHTVRPKYAETPQEKQRCRCKT